MPSAFAISLRYHAAQVTAALRPRRRHVQPMPARATEPGITVVIPSRNGRDLLAAQLPGVTADLAASLAEIIVVDNGSDDGTAAWLHQCWPAIHVEHSAAPLSFAAAVNRGILRARYSHVCLLNNDMLIEPGFFQALARAFEEVPDLFCATAQIFFPPGVRREETGKAVFAQTDPESFPVRCDEPIPGEDLTWVLYGSGGCSLYHAARLRTLGGIDETYAPVYVEDLDIGYRGWLRGWPTVYVAGARLEHRHRATTSRYYTSEQLDAILEINYLRFLARAVGDQRVYRKLWLQALDRLSLLAPKSASAWLALRSAWRISLAGGAPEEVVYPEELLLRLTSGAVAVVPGRAASGVLVTTVDRLQPLAPELLIQYAHVVLVARSPGDSAYNAALYESRRRWGPQAVKAET